MNPLKTYAIFLGSSNDLKIGVRYGSLFRALERICVGQGNA